MMQKDAEVGRIAMAVPVIICILHIHLVIQERTPLPKWTHDADEAGGVNDLA